MHNSILQAFLGAPRAIKRAISIGYDCLAITLAFYLAYALRMGELAVKWDVPVILCLAVTLAVSILAFIRMGLYRAILRYITQQAINTLVVGVLISSAVMAVTGFFLHAFLPRSVPIIYALTAFILIGMPRILLRNMIHMLIPKGKIKVVIYGAGSAGSRLASQLSQGTDFSPVAFVDDDKKLVGNIQHGLTVYEPNKLNVLIERYQVTRVLLALGGIDHKERIRIIRYLEPLLVQVQTIPPMEEIMKGSAQINDLRNIQIEDLLGREAVAVGVQDKEA